MYCIQKENDLRQQDVAKALGLYDSSTYRSWETGRSSPKPDMLVKIAQMYNISLDTLMGNTARSGDNRFSISGNKYNEDVYGDRYLSKLQTMKS
ncbi:MAG: helix-turn-helix domain-containing protein [Eubacterium sp.]